jgi:hypothetical protein
MATTINIDSDAIRIKDEFNKFHCETGPAYMGLWGVNTFNHQTNIYGEALQTRIFKKVWVVHGEELTEEEFNKRVK